MKKLFKIIICFSVVLCLCSCDKKNADEQIVFLPDSNTAATVNGYKNPSVSAGGADNSSTQSSAGESNTEIGVLYIANTSTKKFHLSTCRYAKSMKDEYKKESSDRSSLISEGFSPCKVCNP